MNIATVIPAPVRLALLPRMQRGTVAAVDWAALTVPEARRLRELGLDEGVEVELLKGSGILGGPVACRIGRMTVALRRHVAGAIHVSPLVAGPVASAKIG
jgi:ferrous iron transport protein A